MAKFDNISTIFSQNEVQLFKQEIYLFLKADKNHMISTKKVFLF